MKTIKIFIASSSELEKERRECIITLHKLNQSHKHVRLEPILWEFSMVKSNYPGKVNIQDAINPKLTDSTIAVFIFYSKIGKYTKEEFNLISKQKRCFVYFKKGFIPSTKTHSEYNELIEFRKRISDTILFEDFDEFNGLDNLLYQNLNLYLAENYPSILEEKLQESEEIRKQQTQDLIDLKSELSASSSVNALKKKALEELENGILPEAEYYLTKALHENKEDTASTYYELGKLKHSQLEYSKALDFYELAINLSPENSSYLNSGGAAAFNLGYFNEAIKYYEKVLLIEEKKYGNNDIKLAKQYNNLGMAYRRKGSFSDAIKAHKRSIEILVNNNDEDNLFFGVYLNNLGLAFNEIGEFDKAIQFYKYALSKDLKIYGENHPYIASRFNNLACSLEHKKEFDVAIDLYKGALQILQKLPNGNLREIAATYNNLGNAYRQASPDYDLSISYLEKSNEINRNLYGNAHPSIAITYNNLGLTYAKMGDNHRALQNFQEALSMDKKYFDEVSKTIANRYNSIGGALFSLKEYDKALDYFERAYSIFNVVLPKNHPYRNDCKDNIENAIFHLRCKS